MHADRAAGSGPEGLPLPPASTTRNVSLAGTPEVVPLPPFHGSTPPSLNGQHAAPDDRALPESASFEPPTDSAEPSFDSQLDPVGLESEPHAALEVEPLPGLEGEPITALDVEPLPGLESEPITALDVEPLPGLESDADPYAGFQEFSADVIRGYSGETAPEIDEEAAGDPFAGLFPETPVGTGALEAATQDWVGADRPLAADGWPDVQGWPPDVPDEVTHGTEAVELTDDGAEGAGAEMSWENAAGQGTVEPAFEEDVHATEEMLADRARGEEEFPLDAFIIPEDTRRLPSGVTDGEHPSPAGDDVTAEIAARFEQLSKRLREEDVNALLQKLARGDRLDTLLAGFLAGYLPTHDA